LINHHLFELVDQQLVFNKIQIKNINHQFQYWTRKIFVATKEAGTQTESFIPVSIVHVNRSQKQMVMHDFSQSTKYHRIPTIGTKKRMSKCSSKFSKLIPHHLLTTLFSVFGKQYNYCSRFRFNNSFAYTYMKFILIILFAIMTHYHLLTESTFIDKSIDSITQHDFSDFK
jgi:hypothetical protein